MLQRISRTNGFLVGLDPRGEWFRYHHLFADLLGLELLRADPAAGAGLHHRASDGFADQGLPEEAVDHAVATGDTARVVQILRDQHTVFLRSSRAATLITWIGALPEEVLLDAPELAAVAAISSCML